VCFYACRKLRTKAYALGKTQTLQLQAQGMKGKNPAKTSARSLVKKGNLTLHDWLTIIDYFDSHSLTQAEVVKYFHTCPEGTLIFTQSALSWHLSTKGCEEDQHHIKSNPTALSSKRPCVVTCPDIEQALLLWV